MLAGIRESAATPRLYDISHGFIAGDNAKITREDDDGAAIKSAQKLLTIITVITILFVILS